MIINDLVYMEDAFAEISGGGSAFIRLEAGATYTYWDKSAHFDGSVDASGKYSASASLSGGASVDNYYGYSDAGGGGYASTYDSYAGGHVYAYADY